MKHLSLSLSSIMIANRVFQRLYTEPLKLCSRRYQSMFAWKISDSLNNQNEVEIENKLKYQETKLPTISSPSDVLIKVYSTSINPLDVRMVYGYGRRVLDLLDIATNCEPRITNDRYPLTLGRDFSGEVVATGPYASEYKPGDLVFGVVEPQKSGAHAQYVTVPSYCITKKPDNLSHNQAASIPFVALTAYSALCTFGNLTAGKCNGKQVLVLGGSGGVGSFAVQLLKWWGANVAATCSESKMDWLENELFVDRAICYENPAAMESLKGSFDFVLDCADYDRTSLSRHEIVTRSLHYLKPYSGSVYVTLSPPVLSNTDEKGIVLGTSETIVGAVCDTLRGLSTLNSARWAFFLPNKRALEYVSHLYEDEVLSPQVSSVIPFGCLPEAYKELQGGNARGKIVVDVTRLDSGGGESTKEEDETNRIANSGSNSSQLK